MFSARQGFYFSSSSNTGIFNPQLNIISGGDGQAGLLNDNGTIQLLFETNGNGNFGAMSLNNLGVFEWQKQLNPSTNDSYWDIAKDDSGNIYGCGWSGTDKVGYVTCQNSSGTIVWQKKFTSTVSSNAGVRIWSLVYSNNYIYAVGTDNTASSNTFSYLFKIDASTGVVANKYKINPGGATTGTVNNISIDIDGNLYIGGGYTTGSGIFSYIAKFTPSLSFTWGRLISTTPGQIYSIAIDSQNNVYATASATGSSGSFIIKFNSSGTFQWRTIYNQSGTNGWGNVNNTRALGIDNSDNVYMVIHNNSTTSNQNYILKINSTGTIAFTRFFKSTTSGVGVTLQSISINTSSILLVGRVLISGLYSIVVLEVPTDGTNTGIYGTYSYNSSTSVSGTSSTPTITNMASTPITTTTDITVSDGTKTQANTSETQSITYL